jgi:D-alanine-D-alanine ligase
MAKHVAVLKGGWSAEREVSLNSGAAVARGLREAGYRVTEIDVTRDIPALIAALTPKPDVVFNALHGRWGEDGCLQGVLDIMGVPYTHSGLLASALAMDKPMAKRLFALAGIPVPMGRVFHRDELVAGEPMARPYVIKPINEGSSVGVHIMREGTNTYPCAGGAWPFETDNVLVEQFIPGREITVAVMGDRALGALEITSERGFYDYEAKYAPGGSLHVWPAPLPKHDYDEALRLALLAHQTLGCRGVSRADLRYDDTRPGEPPRFLLLEVNTQPGMTATSLVPDIAGHVGISFPDLVSWMVENAVCDL